MKRFLFLFTVFFLPALAGAQEYRPPRDLPALVSRVQQFWTNMAGSQRLKALEFVLPERKELFLAGGNMPFVQPKVAGIEFTADADRALVRVSVKLLAKEAPSGYLSWTVTDSWVWKRNAWYLDLQDAKSQNPFLDELEGENTKARVLISRDLESKLSFPQAIIDVGVVPQGERRKLSIPVHYSGEVPLSIVVRSPGNLLSFDSGTEVLTSDTKEIPVWLISEGWEGPFALPVSFEIQYQGVTVERRVSLMGSIFAPLMFRQDPSPFKTAPNEPLSISVHNATARPVQITSVLTDDKFEIIELPQEIPPNGDGTIRLSRKPGEAGAPGTIYIRLAEPVNGRSMFAVPLRLAPSTP